MKPCPEMGRFLQGMLVKEPAGLWSGWDMAQEAGLMGRWPVGQQACDGQSRGRHPQTAGTGAFYRTELGFPWTGKGFHFPLVTRTGAGMAELIKAEFQV